MTSILLVAVILSYATISESQHRYVNQRFNRYQRLYNQPQTPLRAVAVLRGQTVSGVIHFDQQGDLLRVFGQINGLKPGYHGFHVHQFGDLTDSCTSAGPHFNPQKREHGSPYDYNRHAGDLGNIEADDKGTANVDVSDYFISIVNQNAIIGRAVVVHADIDDLGRGGHELSKSTGNSGGRLACGVIGWAKD